MALKTIIDVQRVGANLASEQTAINPDVINPAEMKEAMGTISTAVFSHIQILGSDTRIGASDGSADSVKYTRDQVIKNGSQDISKTALQNITASSESTLTKTIKMDLDAPKYVINDYSPQDVKNGTVAVMTAERILANQALGMERIVERTIWTSIKNTVVVGNDLGQGTQVLLGAGPYADADYTDAVDSAIRQMKVFSNMDDTATTGLPFGDIEFVLPEEMRLYVTSDTMEALVNGNVQKFVEASKSDFEAGFVGRYRGVAVIEDNYLAVSPITPDANGSPTGTNVDTPFILMRVRTWDYDKIHLTFTNDKEKGTSRLFYLTQEWDDGFVAKFPELIFMGVKSAIPLTFANGSTDSQNYIDTKGVYHFKGKAVKGADGKLLKDKKSNSKETSKKEVKK